MSLREIAGASSVAGAVANGLGARAKSLPAWLLYDAAGSALYERITELDEYYPTRTERRIFSEQADAIVASIFGSRHERVTVVELGAGTAEKTVVLLRAMTRVADDVCYVPIDVSAAALAVALTRLATELPAVRVRALEATHEQAFAEIRQLTGPKCLLFIGSSIGNYDDGDGVRLLSGMRRALGEGDALVLGTDLAKSPAVLVPAYDDALGVTAAFNLNVLTRINRELGADFELARFRHVALWNSDKSRIEMHLESTAKQTVRVAAIDMEFHFEAGERIHTESSVKYDLQRIDRMFGASGFARERTFEDDRQLFAVHVARAVRQGG